MTEREQPPTDVGAGYPEDGQPGTGIDPREHAENDIPDGEGADTKPRRDGEPSEATGNPNAAGG